MSVAEFMEMKVITFSQKMAAVRGCEGAFFGQRIIAGDASGNTASIIGTLSEAFTQKHLLRVLHVSGSLIGTATDVGVQYGWQPKGSPDSIIIEYSQDGFTINTVRFTPGGRGPFPLRTWIESDGGLAIQVFVNNNVALTAFEVHIYGEWMAKSFPPKPEYLATPEG